MPFTLGHPVYGGTETRFKKGHKLRVGMKHKPESIEKMVKNRTGKSMGESNPSWKGGVTKFIIKVKRLTEYKQWQKAVFNRDNFTCRNCGKRGGTKIPHHLKAFSYLLNKFKVKTIQDAKEYKALWDIDNGVTLCIPCHEKTPNYSWKAVKNPIDSTIYEPIMKGEN